jgi:hypothetical protein
VEQDGVQVFALQHVELSGEIVDRVGDELFLRVPAPVDRVLAHARACRNRVHRRRLEAAFGQ